MERRDVSARLGLVTPRKHSKAGLYPTFTNENDGIRPNVEERAALKNSSLTAESRDLRDPTETDENALLLIVRSGDRASTATKKVPLRRGFFRFPSGLLDARCGYSCSSSYGPHVAAG